MRAIDIKKDQDIPGFHKSSRVFKNADTQEIILCAFVEKYCSPDCAACDIQSRVKEMVNCLRGGFILGKIE